MLQYLPTEIILSIASHATPETKGTIAQTCHTCYSAIVPLLWRYLPLKAIENVDGVVNRLIRNNWIARATQFVHAITLTSDSVSHNTLEEIQTLIGAMESGYPYILDGHPGAPPFEPSILPAKTKAVKKSFGDAVLELIHHFPRTSYFTFDYYLALPYLLTSQSTSLDDTTAITTTTTTSFNGSLTISHYRPNQIQDLLLLLAPFTQLTELSIQAQEALSYSDDKDAWSVGDADMLQLSEISMDQLEKLTIIGVDDHVELDVYRTLIESKPRLKSLTLKWRYRPKNVYILALENLVDKFLGWQFNRIEADNRYIFCLTRS
ncbi:hypothetical protein BCR42DRAFT_416976 [Absidia repens]|uniref:F-box domain-containing protein n=1 Tax=Absidia repens TaxID=90262 RepID=A0A1X2IEN2_9FUNG|nr:hypothetical protein BCR42DRAFT_416976 [Absidia repens]